MDTLDEESTRSSKTKASASGSFTRIDHNDSSTISPKKSVRVLWFCDWGQIRTARVMRSHKYRLSGSFRFLSQNEVKYDYDKLLNPPPLNLPASIIMTCTPKPTYEDDMALDDVRDVDSSNKSKLNHNIAFS